MSLALNSFRNTTPSSVHLHTWDIHLDQQFNYIICPFHMYSHITFIYTASILSLCIFENNDSTELIFYFNVLPIHLYLGYYTYHNIHSYNKYSFSLYTSISIFIILNS